MARFHKDSSYAWWVKNDSEAVEQACTRLKTAKGLGGGGEGAQICKHNARMDGFKKNSYAVKQACTSGGGVGGAPAPQICTHTHTARVVNGGASKDSD